VKKPTVHEITTKEEPSKLYEGATNYIAECSCGWHRERPNKRNRDIAISLHREHTSGS